MKKPMVGIVPLVDMERESYWMLPGYMKGLEKRRCYSCHAAIDIGLEDAETVGRTA